MWQLKDGQQVVLWFEHDLYDQLQLADALALAAPVGTPELIVVDSFPGRPGFRGHGLALGPRRPPPDPARPVTSRARARRPRRPGYR